IVLKYLGIDYEYYNGNTGQPGTPTVMTTAIATIPNGSSYFYENTTPKVKFRLKALNGASIIASDVKIELTTSPVTNITNNSSISSPDANGYILITIPTSFLKSSGNVLPINVTIINGNFTNIRQIAFGSQALPVTLSNFTAKATTDNKVNLAWVTASESNNKGFRIERKAEGESKFNAIGYVASKAEAGNSQLSLSYSFKDMTAPMGSNMYRLVQEDIDGKQTISDVRIVKLNGQSVVSVYPNPSNGAFTINRTNDGKKMNVQILDQMGRIINQYQNIIDSNLRLNIPQSGVYQIKLMYPETGEQSIQRIVIQH
ncbi:MAG: T9SS type A sorting domain-containing protein, partial [Flavobacteriales bacterium]